MRRKRNDKAGTDDSFLEGGEQGVLFAIVKHPVEAEALETKQCTAALLFKRDPTAYAEIVEALGRGMPIRDIKQMWGVGTGTVYAIQRREGTKVGTLKKAIAQELLLGGLAGAQRAAELIVDCKDPVQAAMATDIMLKNANLMNGQATAISEHRVIHVDATGAAAKLSALAAEMGLGAGEKSALGRDVGPLAGQQAEDLALPPAGRTLDIQSAVVQPQSVEPQALPGSCHTPCHEGTPPASNFEGGGGDQPGAGPATSQ